jgi:hypothetical protein
MKHKLLTASVILIFALLLTFNSYSYPKFAAYTGNKCMDCHVNPTGGGMRQDWGVKYSQKNLFFKFWEKANKTTEIEPNITKGISMGADMRMLFMDNEVDTGFPNRNSFFQMQGDLYVYAEVNKYISLMIAPGLYIPSTIGTSPLPTKYEIYGMVSNLPAGLYFKVGRFIPNFGVKIPEHRAYNRDFNDFYTPYASDAGIEVGISPSFFTLTAGFSNGSSVTKDGQRNNSFDFDNQKQLTVSGDFRWASKKSKYTAGIGGSFLTNPYKYDLVNNVNALRQMAAGFVSFGLFQRVAILGEFAYNRLDIRDPTSTRSDFRTIFAEINGRLTQGLELKVQYENYDNALGTKDATTERQRYSAGAVFYPLTGLEVESIFRLVKEGDGGIDFEMQNNEFQTTFKFYF